MEEIPESVADLGEYRDQKERDNLDPRIRAFLMEVWGPNLHPWAMYAAEKRFMDLIDSEAVDLPETDILT